MRCALWSRMCSVASLVGLLGGVFLVGGCGQEPAKPKAGPPPAATSQQPPGAQPLTPEPPAPPTVPPEKPTTPAPEEKPQQDKAEPEKTQPPAAQPSEEKEKPSPPSPEPAPAKQETAPTPPPAEKAPSADASSPTAPVSSYAPADDLEAQMEQYLQDLQKAVENEENFKDAKGRLPKDANTLIVLALALGLHEQPNKYQKAAPALMAAAKELASAKDLASAKKAVESLVGAAAAQGDPSTLKWEKVATLHYLMEAVPLISNKIRDSSLTPARLEKRAKEYAGYAAVLAVIAQASLPHADETEKPTEVEKWQQFCLQMRAAAGELNAAIRAKNPEAALQANAKLRQSCDDCHAVFHTKQTPSKDDKE